MIELKCPKELMLTKHKNLLSHVKMMEEIITFGDTDIEKRDL